MERINLDDTYIINPFYTLRSDIHRAIITNTKGTDTSYNEEDIVTSFCWILHPVIAAIFTYFDGSSNLYDTVTAISEDFDLDSQLVNDIVYPVIQNKNNILLHNTINDNICSTIPKNFIVRKKENDLLRNFDVNDFIIPQREWDLNSKRLYIPSSLTFMLNNKCVTDCVYCYADKKTKVAKLLDFERVKSIVEEAVNIGIVDFAISGGEVFLYPYWKDLLALLYSQGFNPYISTKIPLTENDIVAAKNIGLKRLQVSFDSDDTNELMQILNVKADYHERMLKTLDLLCMYDIEVVIKSVISKYNCSIHSMTLLLERLSKYDNIKHISVAPAEASLYKKFDTYNVKESKMDEVLNFVRNYHINKDLKVQDYTTGESVNSNDIEYKRNLYYQRAQCTANFSALYILPDGKVGICEELYWHPDFILGDLNDQSIIDVWNSKKANELYNYSKDIFPDNSPCKECPEFDICRKIKGVCWKMVYHAYGKDDIFYKPDPRCPYALKNKNIFFYKD